MHPRLAEILSYHRARCDADRRDLTNLQSLVATSSAPRDFLGALRVPGLSVIAEIKRRSPSKGELALDLDVASTAEAYESGGAACLSVLTDSEFFDGSSNDLITARAATRVPVLRKDFTLSAADVYDARIMGADAILLIVSALEQPELVQFSRLAADIGMAVLVECHDHDEIDRAIESGAELIGINQRDLKTFEINDSLAQELAEFIPTEIISVAESGIRTPVDVAGLAGLGFDAVLVGEALVKSSEPRMSVAAMAEAGSIA